MKVPQSSLRAQRFSEFINILLLCLSFVGVGWENLWYVSWNIAGLQCKHDAENHYYTSEANNHVAAV